MLLPGKIRAYLERMKNLHPEVERRNYNRIQVQIQDVESKLDHIRSAIEEGGSYRVFHNRIEELEKERDRLAVLETASRLKVSESVSIESTEEMVTNFMSNFEERIALLTVPEKREIIRKCVDQIYVDHERKVIRCFVRKIPVLNNELMDLYTKEDKNKLATVRLPVVSSDVAGGGTSLNPAK